MHIAPFLSLLAFLAVVAHAERSVDIFAWPLTLSKSQSLASISYNSTSATVKKYTPLQSISADDVVRIGFYHASGEWSGVATAASNFAQSKDKKVQLYINSQDELYHIGFKAGDQGSSSKTGKSKDGLGVEVITTQRGPTPHLNKPVLLNAEGQVDQKEPEKTFFQKYWWVIVGFLILQVVVAGGAKD